MADIATVSGGSTVTASDELLLYGLIAAIGGMLAYMLLKKAPKKTEDPKTNDSSQRASEGTPSMPTAPSSQQDIKGLVDPAVFAAFPAWVEKFEGSIPTMYQDVIGLITTGVGNLIDSKGTTPASNPPARTFALPWLRPDGSPASQAEIRADWQRVKRLPAAMVASRYADSTALHLSPSAIDELVRRTAATIVTGVLVKTFPEFSTYPPPVQTALLGMAWGLGSFGKFPTLVTAVRVRDWTTAAANCKIKNANQSRNDAHRDLFLSAVGVV